MSGNGTSALQRRISPSVPLALELTQDNAPPLRLNFRLAFDFRAFGRIADKTGLDILTGGELWRNISSKNLGILFWASLLAHHPQYDSDEGLEVALSYMDLSNAEEISRAITDAFMLFKPEGETARPTPATADALSAGSISGPSRDSTSASASRNSSG